MTNDELQRWASILRWVGFSVTAIGILITFGSHYIADRLIVVQRIDKAKAQERQKFAEDQITAANTQAEEAKKLAAALAAKQADWELSGNQREKLIAALRTAPKGKVEIEYILSEAERAVKFAKLLETLFRETGYELYPEIGMFSSPDYAPGIYLVFNEDKDKERALAYCQAFLDIGITSKWIKRKPSDAAVMPWTADTVSVMVRQKP